MNNIYILIILFFVSCAKTSNCKEGGLNIKIVNLTLEQNDTFLITTFKKNSLFDQEISKNELILYKDTQNQNTNNENSFELKGNENNHSVDKNNKGYFMASYDYTIKTKNHLYRLSEICTTTKTKKCGGLLSLECPDCYNPATSFILNNEKIELKENELFEVEN